MRSRQLYELVCKKLLSVNACDLRPWLRRKSQRHSP